jgi:hypothetical protein
VVLFTNKEKNSVTKDTNPNPNLALSTRMFSIEYFHNIPVWAKVITLLSEMTKIEFL